MMVMELSDSEKLILAREIAADSYEPPSVTDVLDVLRMPRDSFIAGWDAAMAHQAQVTKPIDDGDEAVPMVILNRPTRWKDFVEQIEVVE